MSKDKNKSINLILCLLILIGISISFIAISQKKGMHVDEYYSYGLSNNTNNEIYMSIELGKKYDNPHETFNDYMTVDADERFSYRNVWEKQSLDVHPPIYYVLLHTICSFFPNTFNIWFAGSINLLFFAGTILFMYLAMKELYNNHKIALAASGMCALSGGLIQITTFLRMYTLLMFFVIILTWLHLKYYTKQPRIFFTLYPVIIFVGMMTHYYFLIFLFLQGIYFGISLLLRKRLKNAILYLGETIVVLCTSVTVFPAMLEHIFLGYRGKESIDNLMASSGYLDGIIDFLKIISRNLTGGILYIIIILFTGISIYQFVHNRKLIIKPVSIDKWGLIYLPATLYFFLISKVAVYHYDRYISVIYPLLILLIVGMTHYILSYIPVKSKAKWKLFYSILGCCIILSYFGCDWIYLQTDTAHMKSIANDYSKYDCIIVNNGINFWNHTLYYEVENSKSLTFLSSDQIDMYSNSDVFSSDPVVVYIIDYVDDKNAVLTQIIEQNPAYSEAIHIVNNNFANGYFIK